MGLLISLLRSLFGQPSRRKGRSVNPHIRGAPKPDRVPRGPSQDTAPSTPHVLRGKCYVIDGDTIVIAKTHIRLAGIDAPELDHPWGIKSKWAMVHLCKGQVIEARVEPGVTYDRIVARCFLPDGRDLAEELVKQGLAIDWPKYSGGRYRRFEPDGVRKKLWRAAARQQGRYKPGT